jgi:hypothetical protein
MIAFPVVAQYLAQVDFVNQPYSDASYWRMRNRWMFAGLDGLLVGSVLSVVLGFWWAWRCDKSAGLFGRAVSSAVLIEVVNITVAFAGCSALGAVTKP